MGKKNSRNNDFLNTHRNRTSEKTYSLLLKLVNEDREDLAKIVVKIDYLLEYASSCIKQKEFEDAREALDKAKSRIDKLSSEDVNIAHLEYLYTGISTKCK